MSINPLTVFAANGEKNTTGLNQADGFPLGQKPARQWFNFLLNAITAKINEVVAGLENEETARNTAVSQEASSRQSADQSLQSQIDSEETARANGDQALQSQIDNMSAIVAPVGAIFAYAGNAAPVGWLECNGQSTAGFSALAGVVGANVPDLRGEFIRGWDHGRGVDGGRDVGSWQEATSISPQVVGHAIIDIRDADSEVKDGTVGNSGAGVNSAFDRYFKRVRPRNVAMMYIIKT